MRYANSLQGQNRANSTELCAFKLAVAEVVETVKVSARV